MAMQYFTMEIPAPVTTSIRPTRPPPTLRAKVRRACHTSYSPTQLVLLLFTVTAILVIAAVIPWTLYCVCATRKFQLRMSASPLETYINPRSSLAATGPEYCRLFRGPTGLYSLKCRDGVGLDAVYAGQGGCKALAYGRDEWWQPGRWWVIECDGPGGKVLGGIKGGKPWTE